MNGSHGPGVDTQAGNSVQCDAATEVGRKIQVLPMVNRRLALFEAAPRYHLQRELALSRAGHALPPAPGLRRRKRRRSGVRRT